MPATSSRDLGGGATPAVTGTSRPVMVSVVASQISPEMLRRHQGAGQITCASSS